jgi:Na+/melibiose symporter-like transporter
MRTIRIVLLIANAVWFPIFVFGGASHVYYFATYQTPHDQAFVVVLLAVAIPTVVCSFILAGNVAYIWCSRPRKID